MQRGQDFPRRRGQASRRPPADRNKKQRRGANRQQQLMDLSSAQIPRDSRLSPYPSEMTIRCTVSLPLQLADGSNAWTSIDFKANDVRSPFSTTLSANGFSLYSQIYRIFRVQKCTVKFIAVNTETVTPINIVLSFNDTQPSTLITSWDAAVRYAGQGFTTRPIIVGGSNGANRTQTIRYGVNCGDVLGDNLLYHGAAGYAGSDTASPTQTIWANFAAYTYAADEFFADGLDVNAEIVWTTRFSSMRPLIS